MVSRLVLTCVYLFFGNDSKYLSQDIDCMPLNPLENMPEALKRHRFSVTSKELQMSEHSNIGEITTSEHLENAPSPMNTFVKRAQVRQPI